MVLVQVLVVKPVQSGVVDLERAGSRGASAGETSSRQLRVSSESPVMVSTTVAGAGVVVTNQAASTSSSRAGSAGRDVTLAMTPLLAKAEAMGARSVTLSVAVN